MKASKKFFSSHGVIWAALLVLTFVTLESCSTYPHRKTEKVYKQKAKAFSKQYKEIPKNRKIQDTTFHWQGDWIGSVNFGTRKPNFVIIHHTAQNSVEQTVRTFHLERTAVSSHYVIGRNGEIIQMVNDLFRAHHAGLGKWGNDTDLNSSSIGIELDNNGLTDPWPEIQIQALLGLLGHLKEKYKIPQANFLGHMDIAPTRKNDPARFPWKIFAEHGFGYWYDEAHTPAPENFDPMLALRVIGYDLKNPEAAIKAFKRHYIQKDDTAEFSQEDLGILYQIFLKFL